MLVHKNYYMYVGLHPVDTGYDNYIYVLNQGSNTVSVINDTTNKVDATIPVGVHPVELYQFILEAEVLTHFQE